MFLPTPARSLTLLAVALFQIACVLPAPQALPLNLVSDLASTAAGSAGPAHSNSNNNAVANALLTSSSAAPNMNTNTNINAPTDNGNVKHTSGSGSPLDLESLPFLGSGSLDSAVPLGGEENAASVQNGSSGSGSGSGESAGEAHPSGPLSLLGRRAVYSVSPRATSSAGSASVSVPVSTDEDTSEESTTKTKLIGRAERFKARLMRRASLTGSA